MDDELRKAAQDAIDFLTKLPVRMQDVRRASNLVIDLRVALAKPVAAPQDATDWEAVSADQAMTIAMLRVDYQQLQALVTSQGIRLMEAEDDAKDDSVVWHSVGELEQAIKDAAKWRRLISSDVQVMVMGSTIAAAMEQKP